MSEAIFDPAYWKRRLREAGGCLHHAVFKCPADLWESIAKKHTEILARHIAAKDSVLDCGCAWGRLVELLPRDWDGWYLGVDLSPDFIRLAEGLYEGNPRCRFSVGDLRKLEIDTAYVPSFDWAVLISIRPMITRHFPSTTWQQMEKEIRRVAKKLLFLEYDPADEGTVG